jgi:hypothetical protein
MGEERGIRHKVISYDHRGEEAISRSIRWVKKEESVLKSFPMAIEVKKSLPGVSDGRRNRNSS